MNVKISESIKITLWRKMCGDPACGVKKQTVRKAW